MTRFKRLLYLINLFRTHESLTMDDLVRHCRVSKRTVYRDLLDLTRLSIPIKNDNGYRLDGNVELPTLNFTEEEQELIGLSLKSSPLRRAECFREPLQSIEMKILSVLPESRKASLNRYMELDEPGERRLNTGENKLIREFLNALQLKRPIRLAVRGEQSKLEGLYPRSMTVAEKGWTLTFTHKDSGRNLDLPLDEIVGLDIVAEDEEIGLPA